VARRRRLGRRRWALPCEPETEIYFRHNWFDGLDVVANLLLAAGALIGVIVAFRGLADISSACLSLRDQRHAVNQTDSVKPGDIKHSVKAG
jgi:hypothetical protein